MDAEKRNLIKDLRNKKIGLVLCGGGFKGAYHIGVWKGLRELGIKRFHSIAGSSVGALNAILIANDDLKTAERLWKEKEFMSWSPNKMRYYIISYLLLLGPIPIAFLAQGISLLLTYYDYSLAFLFHMFGLSMGIAMLIVSFMLALEYSDYKVFFKLDPELIVLASFIPFGFFIMLDTLIKDPRFAFSNPKFFVIFLIGGIIIGLCCGWLGFKYLDVAHRESYLFSNADVISELKYNLNLNTIRNKVSSLFVTIARGKAYPDPFTPTLKATSSYSGLEYVIDYDWPSGSAEWVPEYHDIAELLDKDKAIKILSITSAIPFVFRTSSSSNKEILTDGGMIDNMPIFPLLFTDVDYIIIVKLNPEEKKESDNLESYINDIWVKWKVPRLDKEEVVNIYRKWMMERYLKEGEHDYISLLPAPPSIMPKRVITIAPRVHLATSRNPLFRFLTGTLNSSIKARKRWLQIGYYETIKLSNLSIH